MNSLFSLKETCEIIASGAVVSVAGDEKLLAQLPKGNWIGATTPYFMDGKGTFSLEKIFVNPVHEKAEEFSIKTYDESNLLELTKDRHTNGYTLLILPPFQPVHMAYAFKASKLPDLYDAPIVGWMAGTNLNNPSTAKVIDGRTGELHETKGVALHVKLPETYFATIDVINIHQEIREDIVVEFLEDTFDVTECIINGQKGNLATYIYQNNIGTTAPIMSDYSGEKINVSFKEVDTETNTVHFYAPVFKDRLYHFGKPVDNYVDAFKKSMPDFGDNTQFSCNCILNYLFGNLEGKSVGTSGPITFGEIGYLLLNQTLTYLKVEEVT